MSCYIHKSTKKYYFCWLLQKFLIPPYENDTFKSLITKKAILAADTLMGQQAALGLTVGVLTGVGGLHDLQDADVIVKDVHECVDMILPQSHREKPIVYQVTSQ